MVGVRLGCSFFWGSFVNRGYVGGGWWTVCGKQLLGRCVYRMVGMVEHVVRAGRGSRKASSLPAAGRPKGPSRLRVSMSYREAVSYREAGGKFRDELHERKWA